MAVVAEITTSVIIGELVDTVLTYASYSWWPLNARGVRAEVEKLQVTIPQVRAILGAVEREQTMRKNQDFDAWQWRFGDALEAADDVLDEIKYNRLEEELKAHDSKVSGPLSGRKRKLVHFVKNAFLNGSILKKLRDAINKLQDVASNASIFLQLAKKLNQQQTMNGFCETGSLLTERRVVGREKEKEIIVQWLMAELDGDVQGLLAVFSIIGIGGMGKTTLAQLVCKDQRVVDNFQLIAWVCVSDNSGVVDAKKVIKKIIEDITQQYCSIDSLSTLQSTLKQKVASKKILLVLDDVWRDDKPAEWEKIVAPLRYSEIGSKIVLTTRMDLVAKMVAAVTEGEIYTIRMRKKS
ncbi:hypothetical protein LUZ60_015364 [Juncus effusus]|nr:hypothetical protein LUZ60_015364 [Juncus effusus]